DGSERGSRPRRSGRPASRPWRRRAARWSATASGARGGDSLLPVTDKVAFMPEGRERPVALGEWAHVMEVAGELMEETDDYPRRYRVRAFPDATALEAIG